MKDLLKVLGCCLVAIVSLVVGGMIVQALKLPAAQMPGNTSPTTQMLAAFLGYGVLAAGLAPLARGLAGTPLSRTGAIICFLVVTLGINTMIEAFFFTTLLDNGIASSIVMSLVPSILIGCAVGLSFGGIGQRAGLRTVGFPGILGRGVIAWIGWPITYLAFGMCVAPIVTPYYHSLSFLRIPTIGTLVEVQLVRSVFFMASSLPLIALWSGSRRKLWLTLGLAHFVAVGGYGLISGTFLPTVLRVSHSIEIACDSFVYAGLLVWLFSASKASTTHETGTANQPHALAH